MARLAEELRAAARAIARMPLVAAVIVLSLGVGIGVNTVVFSWMEALVLRPLPGVPDQGRVHLIESVTASGGRPGMSWTEYLDLAGHVPALPDLAAFRMSPFNVGEASRNERIAGLLVSGNYFDSLGLRPALGRLLSTTDALRPGGEPVVVVSYDFWHNRFAGDPDAIGRTLRVNDLDVTVVGVTPDGFQGTVLGLQFDLWIPATLSSVLSTGSRELEDRGFRGYYLMARLPSRQAVAVAQGQLDAAMTSLAATWPTTNTGVSAIVLPFWRASRGPQAMLLDAIWVLQAVMLVLLLAVCGNTANLLLARATERQREVGIRLAVGAGPWRIVRLLVVENLLLAALGAGVGILIAIWGTNALRATEVLNTAFPVRFQTRVDLMGLAFAVGLAVVCAIACGLAPAVHLARVDPVTALRGGADAPARRSFRNLLMAAEVTLAVVVLLVAGLFFRSFGETQSIDPGFRREGVLLAGYDLSGRGLDREATQIFAARLLEGLRALTDVQGAAIASAVPLDIHGLPSRTFTIEGRAPDNSGGDRALSNTVTPGYFSTMGIAVLEGRDFVALSDTNQEAQAIVNEAFVRRYLPTVEPIGRGLFNGDRRYVIAAVVKDSVSDAFGEAPTPCVYFSYRDRPAAQGEIHVRTRPGAEASLAPYIRQLVRTLDGSLPIYNVRTLAEHVETNLFLRRIPARMFVVLGPLILALAAVGIYAVVAYAVAHRTTEIGVRLALGATPTGVVRQIVVESLMTVSLGALAGWLGVIAIYTNVMRGAVDLAVFAGIPALLLAAAALACWLPARRAAAVDPTVALRESR